MKIRVRLNYLYRAAYTEDYFISNGRSCDHYLTMQLGKYPEKIVFSLYLQSAFMYFLISNKN